MLTSALARPGAAMLAPEPSFVMYRMNALYAGMRFVGVPLARRLRARRRRDARGDRARAAGARLPRLSRTIRPATCSRPPTSSASSRAAPGLVVVDEAYYAFADASFLPRVARVPEPAACCARVEDRDGGLRLGYAVGAPGVDRRTRQGAPAVQLNVLTQAVAPVLLARRASCWPGRRRAIRRERARLDARARRAAGRRRCSRRRPISCWCACPTRRAGSRRCGDAGILVKNLHGSHPLLAHCLRITVGHARTRTTRCSQSLESSSMSDASHAPAPRASRAQHRARRRSPSRSTSTAPAAPSSRPACRSSTTCSTRSRATA